MAYTTINKSTDYFNTVTYTGDGNATQAITNTFQTDFSWIKHRGTSAAHTLQDAVRGFDVTKKICSNSADAENNASGATWGNYGGVSSVGATSFTVALGSNTPYQTNANGANYVAWNWKANGAGSSNTDGSITSTVSANTTSGFSIVTWTGDGNESATVGHGLGSELSCIIIKERTGADWWHNWQKGLSSNSHNVFFNETNVERSPVSDGHVKKLDNTTTFGFDSSTSNVDAVNHSGVDNVAYCFVEKKGYSKFGSYTGNGNANGTFVYTGFKPAFFLVKAIDSVQDWFIYDNKREPYNLMQTRLRPSKNEAENTNAAYYMDFLSNGFKLYTGNAGFNGSGTNYIYMAFAAAPLVGSNNVPCTAR